jgi:hypothetical protein
MAAVPSFEAESLPVRRCESCLLQYALQQFRRRRRGCEARMRQCRLCHNQAEQLRRQRKRGLLTKRRFRQHLTSLKNQHTARGIERVYLDLTKQCGGTEGLVKMWTGTMEKDLAEGGFRAYRHIASIIRLMQHYENAQSDKPDYSTMTDEELLDRLARAEVFGQ